MKYGYARVSTEDQQVDLQLHALRKEACDKIFEEKMSGTTRNRPVLERMLGRLKAKDILVVWKLDRLGRSLQDLLDIARDLQQRGVDLKIITLNIDTSSPTGKLFFHILAAFAEFESALISERTSAGMQAAKLNGKQLGRKPCLDPAQVQRIQTLHLEQKMSIPLLAYQFQCGETTVWRALKGL